MNWRLLGWGLAVLGVLGLAALPLGRAGDSTAAERGWKALSTQSFNTTVVPARIYQDVWKQWGLAQKPADYDRAFRQRYGLHSAPYPNAGLPMGLRESPGLLGKALDNDCLLCHAGSVAGQTIVGLGNASLDLQALYDDLGAAAGMKSLSPIQVTQGRGTIEASAVVAYLMQFRNPDLSLRAPASLDYPNHLYQDVPAWWLLKRKQTRDHTGSIDARSVRTNMAFLLSPLNSGDYIKKLEPVFADILAYMLSVEAPKYPFAIDRVLAARGQELFKDHCARCHGTYGPGGKYPNKHVPLDEIGTDRTLAETLTPEGIEAWNRSWFGQEKRPDGRPYEVADQGGYQAPPLDGVWATAPYFHNASVPTLYHVLNSQARPALSTRSFRTEVEDYDPVRVGWKITVLDRPPDPNLPAIERRKVYDAAQPGRGNGGHTFGDKLAEDERLAVIEYLKTL